MGTRKKINIDIGIARYTHNSPARLAQLERETLAGLEKNPGDAMGVLVLAHVNYIRENYEEAERLFQKCLELDPSMEEARTALAFVYRSMGLREKSDEIIFGA